MIIRRAQLEDIAGLVAIEGQAMLSPWNTPQLESELQSNTGAIWVAASEDSLLGYAAFQICAPECELLRLAVSSGMRRRGVGRALLQHALDSLFNSGCRSCFLEMRSSNDAARLLYIQAGFVPIGCRKKYYHQPVEDAIQYRRDMGTRREDNLENSERN